MLALRRCTTEGSTQRVLALAHSLENLLLVLDRDPLQYLVRVSLLSDLLTVDLRQAHLHIHHAALVGGGPAIGRTATEARLPSYVVHARYTSPELHAARATTQILIAALATSTERAPLDKLLRVVEVALVELGD